MCIWVGHKVWGDCTSGVKLLIFLGGEASCLFNVLEKGNEFENVGFSFCLLVIMKLNYVLDLYKQNQFYL